MTRTVLFVHSSNEMFGADRILLQVIESLAGRPDLRAEVWLPDDVEAAADSVEAHLRAAGIAVRVLPLPVLRRRELTIARLPGLAARALRFWGRVVRTRPVAVYCATSALLIAAPLARVACVRTVILHNQEIWSGGEARILGLLAGWCTHAIAISESARASLLGRVRTRSRTIMNAVPDVLQPAPRPIPPGERPLRFLIASRWNAWKGHGTLLEAWEKLGAAAGRLVIVGSPPEVGIGVDVPAMVARLSHPDTVDVVGQVAGITEHLDRADVLLVPSDDPEPFGLVAVEAFSRYRPVIASDAGGVTEIVTSGRNGLLFPPRDADALAELLRTLTVERAAELGRAGRSDYEAHYSVPRYLAEFARFWAEVIPVPTQSRRYSA
ncbi:glycosyltransferase family 4 protein [Galbitalea soli]|uniref:Glycosyltransferase family 4 protein n=1 Tax=Galbitalea soli TaxID=1268042 RepID=A0A7C9PL29_9MICO|nr:glycosyltransferase family 4 protein [Galbitalea soli]NEM89973.1 glycosyltransferase family 4 protein [Galbitalea soli]NYJ30679.1 glycosyltransferase involved in cell wall biosynthesis [Galbitalea soli]